MNRLATFLLLLLLACLCLGMSPAPDSAPNPSSASSKTDADTAMRVLDVVDGDSMFILYQGKRRELRLMGVDAPEGRQEWGNTAAAYTRDWTRGKDLTLTFGSRKMDQYGRLLAYVWDGSRLLNLDIVRAGLALPYMLKKHEPYFKEINHARKEAKYEGAGFWKQGGLKMEPRIWRKKHR